MAGGMVLGTPTAPADAPLGPYAFEHRDPAPAAMWRDQSRAGQAVPTDATGYELLSPELVRRYLTEANRTPESIEWALKNLPVYRTPARAERGGGFFGGFAPDVGRAEVNRGDDPTRERENVNHEVGHGFDYAYRTANTPWPAWGRDTDENIRADMTALAGRADYPIGAAAAQQVLAEGQDYYHYGQRMDDRIAHRTLNVPPEYAARRLPAHRYAMPPTPESYQAPVGPNPFGPTPPTPPPGQTHRLVMPLVMRGTAP